MLWVAYNAAIARWLLNEFGPYIGWLSEKVDRIRVSWSMSYDIEETLVSDNISLSEILQPKHG